VIVIESLTSCYCNVCKRADRKLYLLWCLIRGRPQTISLHWPMEDRLWSSSLPVFHRSIIRPHRSILIDGWERERERENIERHRAWDSFLLRFTHMHGSDVCGTWLALIITLAHIYLHWSVCPCDFTVWMQSHAFTRSPNVASRIVVIANTSVRLLQLITALRLDVEDSV